MCIWSNVRPLLVSCYHELKLPMLVAKHACRSHYEHLLLTSSWLAALLLFCIYYHIIRSGIKVIKKGNGKGKDVVMCTDLDKIGCFISRKTFPCTIFNIIFYRNWMSTTTKYFLFCYMPRPSSAIPSPLFHRQQQWTLYNCVGCLFPSVWWRSWYGLGYGVSSQQGASIWCRWKVNRHLQEKPPSWPWLLTHLTSMLFL